MMTGNMMRKLVRFLEVAGGKIKLKNKKYRLYKTYREKKKILKIELQPKEN